MTSQFRRNVTLGVAAFALFFAGWATGKEGFTRETTALHCAAFAAKDGLTQAEFEAFKVGLTKLPDMFPGLRRVWIGKLSAPFMYEGLARDHGIAIEFENMAARTAYGTSPRRPEWLKLLDGVRRQGSGNFDIIGE